jgi:drug/metabolite transporter superfamily protein YnfA
LAVLARRQKPLVSSNWDGYLGGLRSSRLQPATFGRAYAAYGGVFIVLSILWGPIVDRVAPDKYDLLGGWIALLGVLVIMYAPRR